jgi:hypothetical protein
LHKKPCAKASSNGKDEHGIGSYVDVAGLLRLTITRAHMRQKGHYNVTMSLGLQVFLLLNVRRACQVVSL